MANMFEFELSAFEYRHIANAVEYAVNDLDEDLSWMPEEDKRKRREAVTALKNLLIIFDGREDEEK